MRAREFLLEYNRQKTADAVGTNLLNSLRKDMGNVSSATRQIRTKVWLKASEFDELMSTLSPEQKRQMVETVLADIESQDPTPNKQYTQWLARMYVNAGGPNGPSLSIEDMNRGDLLRLFDLAKKRRMIRPEHADINRFKSYREFEDLMVRQYNSFEELETGTQAEGKATKVYNDENVTIIVPEDEAAACKYGRGTRWCTASTRGDNYFDSYNRNGKLYILIPKNPKHEGEKYQLHFPSNSFMDENDDAVELIDIFDRFPGTADFFIQIVPELKDKIIFASDKELQQAIESVAELVQEKVWEAASDWETDDDYYYKYLRDEGYVDDDGDIDWDKVEKEGMTYSEFNPEVEQWSRGIMNTVTPTPDDLRFIMSTDPYTYSDYDTMQQLPDAIGTLLKDRYYDKRNTSDNGIGDWVKKNVTMEKEGDQWKAQVVTRPFNATR